MRLRLALFLVVTVLVRADGVPATLRILTVGNSFAYDATHFLPAIAESAGRRVVLFHANSSGASLEKHLALVAAGTRPFTARTHPRTGEKRDFNLREALAAEAWDIVTIQQASPLSFLPESYEPHATTLIAFIREHAPQAEIVIHQTWAYRDDWSGFAKGDLTPATMHARLATAYADLAARHRLRVIPVGDAIHDARQTPRWNFTAYPDPNFDYKTPSPGQVPAQPNSLHQGWRWQQVRGEQRFWHDYLHLNDVGRYLAACVWFTTLFDASPATITYTPPTLPPEDAANLLSHLIPSRTSSLRIMKMSTATLMTSRR